MLTLGCCADVWALTRPASAREAIAVPSYRSTKTRYRAVLQSWREQTGEPATSPVPGPGVWTFHRPPQGAVDLLDQLDLTADDLEQLRAEATALLLDTVNTLEGTP